MLFVHGAPKTPQLQVLLVRLILDDVIDGKIDQVGGVLDLAAGGRTGSTATYNGLTKWATAIVTAQKSLASRMAV